MILCVVTNGPDSGGDVEPLDGERPPPLPEPAAWADIEAALQVRLDPIALQTRKDLEATRLSLDVKDEPLEAVARNLSENSSYEVALLPIAYEEFSQKELRVTLKSQTVTVAEALDLVCAERKLKWWVTGRKVSIAPGAPDPCSGRRMRIPSISPAGVNPPFEAHYHTQFG